MKPVEEKQLKAALKSVYVGVPGASDVLDLLAQGGKRVGRTTVDSVVRRLQTKGVALPRRRAIGVLKALAESGCGTFVVGRHTKPSRLVWSVNAASAGQVACGLDDVFEVFDADLDDLDDDFEDANIIEESDFEDDGHLGHIYRLRHDMTVEFRLPKDLSTTEAARLADFVKTLPFSQQ